MILKYPVENLLANMQFGEKLLIVKPDAHYYVEKREPKLSTGSEIKFVVYDEVEAADDHE